MRESGCGREPACICAVVGALQACTQMAQVGDGRVRGSGQGDGKRAAHQTLTWYVMLARYNEYCCARGLTSPSCPQLASR